jgi:hypothetical protein
MIHEFSPVSGNQGCDEQLAYDFLFLSACEIICVKVGISVVPSNRFEILMPKTVLGMNLKSNLYLLALDTHNLKPGDFPPLYLSLAVSLPVQG